MKHELIESPDSPGHWNVESVDEEGECIKAVFSGPEAKMYAEFYIHAHEAMDKYIDETLNTLFGVGVQRIAKSTDKKRLNYYRANVVQGKPRHS